MNGMLAERLAGKGRICVDTPVLIYFVEENARYLSIIDPVFDRIDRRVLSAFSSYITLLEVLVGPLRRNRGDIARRYRDLLLNTDGFMLFPLDRRVAEEAAEIRAAHDFRTPDAIQLATAVREGADAFLTNDAKLKRFDRLEVLVLDDFVPGAGPAQGGIA